jgi:EpsI family protein
VLGLGPDRIEPLVLREPLETIASAFGEYRAERDVPIPENERRVAGMDQYLFRQYVADSTHGFTLYIGYYEKQLSGKAIHSPKNCLPGAGWEPLQSTTETIQTAVGPGQINRYLLQNGERRALVYYWYQGRGRIEASEYKVKWLLLKDSAIRRRTDEALVRLVVPLGGTMTIDSATTVARSTAATLIPEVAKRIPAA